MVNATFHNPQRQPQVVRLRMGVIATLGLLVLSLLAVGYWWATRGATPARSLAASQEHGTWPAWLKQANTYQPTEEPPKPVPPARDETAEQLMALRRELDLQRQALEALKNRPPPQAPQPAAAPPQKRPHSSMLYVSHTVEVPAQAPGTYTLAPGATKIPCVLETAIHSEVEGYFTCRVSTAVYDTQTGRHLLIPQGSTILGNTQSSTLLYGNERLPTVSLTLTLPSGQSVDLGQAPVTDAQGMNGLTGKVDHKFWKLLGAVLIGGALRGGQQVVQMEAGQVRGIGPVAGGIAGMGGQVANQRLGRSLDSRPTIIVEAGTLCTVILTKPLALAAVGE